MFLGNTIKPKMLEVTDAVTIQRGLNTLQDAITVKKIVEVSQKRGNWNKFAPNNIGLPQERLEELRQLMLLTDCGNGTYTINNRFIGHLIANGALIPSSV